MRKRLRPSRLRMPARTEHPQRAIRARERPWLIESPSARVWDAHLLATSLSPTKTTMTPSSHFSTTFGARILVILACSCSTAAVVLGVAGCDATAQPPRVPPPPSVTVMVSRTDDDSDRRDSDRHDAGSRGCDDPGPREGLPGGEAFRVMGRTSRRVSSCW